ncbi:MAG: glycosyltransferase family 4 protein [Candidatus Micrarchaeia archaeon]
MKICVLNPFYYPYLGGTEKVLFELYSRIARRNEVCVVSATLRENPHEGEEEINGVRVIRLKTRYIDLPGLPMAMPIIYGVPKVIVEESADIYHINNRYLYYHDTLSAITKSKGKLAITLHNALPRGINAFTDFGGLAYDLFWGRNIMNRSDTIIGITQNVVDTTVPKNLLWKTSVVFNGIDYNRFKERKKGKGSEKISTIKEEFENKRIVLNVARLTWQKGQRYLIKAFAELAREHSDLFLIIIGRGPLQPFLYKEAKRYGVEKHFRILSNISEEMLPYYYNAASVFALPSLYEPASVALLEALASKVPAVASRIGGIPEMMKDAGRYCKPNDSEDLAKKMESALEEKSLSLRLSEKGRRLMKKEHDWNKIANKYEALFKNIL